ncbi:N-acetylmuramoyl-L-alanine amidase [filamentous cyanobacterium LEGE 11480]|uniref:N-acetylmuramoyl-L-alanine amidase n=1 Tax=Romeriopsis navalis LEGE 11480 TaxID=2777977 RepID=A0A928Z4B5_9CYAN|nr:N-acetylmuramoyl-L-alanine amidase [Romeriopsis navalis]MBE9030153.1 N-acetylmuramoyl-L-alanine amidase [Romeriopsis navalis LEGE 11480]
MAKFQIANRVTYADRRGWGADSKYPRRGYRVNRKDRETIFIHHTVIVDNDVTKNQWETEAEVFSKMRQLQIIRQKDLGSDVPYNFVVFLMNTNPASIYVCEGRGEDRTGAHTRGHNTKGIGIALQGNFEHILTPLSEYIPLISLFLGWLKFDPNGPNYGGPYAPMSNLNEISYHQKVSNTACPGKHVIEIIPRLKYINPR